MGCWWPEEVQNQFFKGILNLKENLTDVESELVVRGQCEVDQTNNGKEDGGARSVQELKHVWVRFGSKDCVW